MSDPIPHLSILQSPVFLLNSCLGLFTAAPFTERLFSRSYETILPSSLATNHSSALGYSPRPPVSVYGTGGIYLMLQRLFLEVDPANYHRRPKPLVYYRLRFNVLIRQHASPSPLRPRFAVYTGVGILTHLPSASPFGLSLGPG